VQTFDNIDFFFEIYIYRFSTFNDIKILRPLLLGMMTHISSVDAMRFMGDVLKLNKSRQLHLENLNKIKKKIAKDGFAVQYSHAFDELAFLLIRIKIKVRPFTAVIRASCTTLSLFFLSLRLL
jgi:hypothetical protein